MTVYTNKLILRKTDTTPTGDESLFVDGDDYFDFNADLNENWDKIDDFADEITNLSNLSSDGTDYLNNSKALLTGSVSDNAEIYQQILSRYHSSFDLSKFTVVGTPNVTDDGMASNFSTDSYINTGYTIDFDNAETWEICGKINILHSGQSAETLLTTWNKVYSQSTNNGLILGFNTAVNADYYCPRLWASSNASSWDIAAANNTDFVLKFGTEYFYKFKFTGTQYIFSYSEDNYNFSDIILANSSLKIKCAENTENSIIIGAVPDLSEAYVLFNGITDLKYFKIIVNGKSVFSGNKTGLKYDIPYTLSSSGSYIADVFYREKVQELYAQQDYAPFYTIDEENQNFTLPMGEIYGMKQDKLTAGKNVNIENNVISAPETITYNNIGGGILEAPNGVLQILNSGTQLKIPKGLKVLVSDGKNSDNTLNNFEFTTNEDISADISSSATGYLVVFLLINKANQTASIHYRNSVSQFFEQEEPPIAGVNYFANECTWFNPSANIWNNISASTNQWQQGYYVKLAILNITNGIVTSSKIFQPLRLLTYAGRLTNFNQINYSQTDEVPYNTVFTAPEDGMIFITTDIKNSSNYNSPVCVGEVRGLIGERVSIQTVTSGQDVTKVLQAEYTTPGTYTINVPVAGYYTVWLVGGGGLGVSNLNMYAVAANAGGGSGAGFAGELYLTAGNHTVTVGGVNGNTSIDGITAGAGANASFTNLVNATSGVGGTLSVTGTVRNVTLQSNGNSGSSGIGAHVAGGASVYNGWGAGGASNGYPATGYFRLYGIYLETAQTSEIATTGTMVYRHRNETGWDSSGNTVSQNTIQSSVIPIFKGEQFIAFSYANNNSTILSLLRFSPSLFNTK